MKKFPAIILKATGEEVAYWTPDWGWRLVQATLDWGARLGPLVRKDLSGWSREARSKAVGAATAYINARLWHSANLVVQ
jgi:hypothetical protein